MRGSVSPAWLLVGLLPLLVAGITLDPTRIDEGNFGPSWAQYARERDTTPPALALYAAFPSASRRSVPQRSSCRAPSCSCSG